MKRVISVFFLCAFFLLPRAAGAYDTPLKDDKQKAVLEAVAKAHQHFADDFGCKNFAWGGITVNKSGSTTTLKFTPEGQDVKSAKQIMAFTVYNLTGDARADKALMQGAIRMLESEYKKYATVTADEDYTSDKDEPMLFFEYAMKNGDTPVYYDSIFLRTGDRTAAYIQLQMRGEPVPLDLKNKLKEIVFLQSK